MIKGSNITRDIFEYQRDYEPDKLKTSIGYKQQSYVRYSLMDFLKYEFKWQYWLTVTFGYSPVNEIVNDTLCASHYRFDRWLLTNNQLKSIDTSERSEWVCIPEYGSGKKLHYNCYLKLNIKPDKKTYASEWDALRVVFRTIFKSLQNGKFGDANMDITYDLRERNRCNIDAVNLYNTKEMRQQYINETGNDNFANMILSWRDWNIIPLSKKSPQKKVPQLSSRETNLTRYMK